MVMCGTLYSESGHFGEAYKGVRVFTFKILKVLIRGFSTFGVPSHQRQKGRCLSGTPTQTLRTRSTAPPYSCRAHQIPH